MRALQTTLLMLWASMSTLGCGDHEHDHGHDQHAHQEQVHGAHGAGHAHHEGAVSVTRWTERLELFAEHPPALAGEELPFLAHLTVLEGFEPLESANVTLVLDGPAHVEASVDAMLRPGIFQPVAIAPKAGTYRARLVVTGPVVEDDIDGFVIAVYPNPAAIPAGVASHDDSDTETISLLKEQQWKMPFATAFAEQRAVVPSIEVAGEVTTPPGGRAHVGAPIAGRLAAPPAGLPRPGKQVRAGDVLATLAPSPASPEDAARASLAVAEAQARLSNARAAVARSERLLEAQAIPEREANEAQRELEVAQEALQAARRSRRLYEEASAGRGGGSWRVKAPISGTLIEVRATPGESVSAGQLLFRIVDDSELWLRAKVPEQQAVRLRLAHDISYRVTGAEQWRTLRTTGDSPEASLVHVDPTVDPQSRTVAVTYSLLRPDPQLRIGGLVYFGLPAGEPTTGVALPRSAVLVRDGRHVTYVQVSGESFVERAVEVGARAGNLVAVERGIEPGERVVTRGGQLLRLASRGAAGAGHGHVH